MNLEPVIGLEVHAQLKTSSKAFCSCPTEFGAGPNDHTCPVCLGMPGVLPVLNKKAVEYAIKAGIALNCTIAPYTKFDRKNYFYPDLPKGYQISQYDMPVCKGGHITVEGRDIKLNRAHLEEDAGKLVHAGADGLHGSDYSLVDFNRSGTPLLEIVSEPDLTSADEARKYLIELRNILRYIDICDGNLEEGSFRCDANVSMKPKGAKELGTKAEIKNMNSFRSVQRAIESEIERQTGLIEQGKKIIQESRLWDDNSQTTHSMRSKEEAHDYRYFPEPDLVPLNINSKWVDDIKSNLPELPAAKRNRYTKEYGLTDYDASVLTESKEMALFFDQVLELGVSAKPACNLLINNTINFLKEEKLEFSQLKLTARNLIDLIDSQEKGIVGSTAAKNILLPELLVNGGNVQDIIEQKGLAQVSDENTIKAHIEEIISRSPDQVESYKSGKTKIKQYFFGQVMKATKGKADPKVINKSLDDLLPKPDVSE